MRGVIFTTFLDLVEQKFDLDMVDEILDDAKVESDGAYTAVGSYDHTELIQLVTCLSKHSGKEASELVQMFGKHLLHQLRQAHGDYFENINSTFDFLDAVDGKIHVEVRKLYPTAELPRFYCERPDDRRMIMTYESTRPFADLAEGMIQAAFEFFDEPFEMTRTDLSEPPGTRAEFRLELTA